ncbi:geranylgeranylglycerol-phosphate geranylgeranyltransferase [Flavobacteriaceae bacterium]|nr:geranylgeranylglycerol-phosphate geranylgeranyltransferase [Flavobacteriaceae bacterium]
MLSRKQKHIMLKFFSLFSVVRGYNILVIILAQYLTSIYILAPELPLGDVLFDVNVLMLVLSSSAAIAAGYIINSFYDSDKDLINRPTKTVLDRLVSQNTKLSGYFILNCLSLVCASYVSFRAVLFFMLYIFAIWFYSHKLKKFLFIGNLTASILAVIPFFAVFIYYQNFNNVIFVHATFLFLLIAMKELTKDLENIKGDLAQNYKTIPVVYGVVVSKKMLTALSIATFIPALLLLMYFSIGYMDYYFYASIVTLLFFDIFLWKSNKRSHFLTLHNMLKCIIVAGVFSIVLINVHLVLSRVF